MLKKSQTDCWGEREVSVHWKTRQQKNCRSQFSACVANSAAVTEFLCYITHLLSKSPENTQHCCPLVHILKPGINQSALCSVSRKYLVCPWFYLLNMYCSIQPDTWGDHDTASVWQDLTQPGPGNYSCNFEWYLNTTSATLGRECECTWKHHELYIKTVCWGTEAAVTCANAIVKLKNVKIWAHCHAKLLLC